MKTELEIYDVENIINMCRFLEDNDCINSHKWKIIVFLKNIENLNNYLYLIDGGPYQPWLEEGWTKSDFFWPEPIILVHHQILSGVIISTLF